MKKIIAVIVVTVLIFFSWFVYSEIDTAILKNSVDDLNLPIYIPNGMADEIEDFSVGFDAHLIWKYELNEQEISAIEENLSNGVWKTPAKKEYENVVSLFFAEELGSKIDDVPQLLQSVDGKYWCLYNNGKFVDEINFGRVFIYDSISNTYWCSCFKI